MIHYRNNGIGLKLIRKKTTKEDSEERRIYWQITYKRRSVLYYTGSSFTEAEWDDILNKNLRKHKLVKEGYQNFFDYTIRPIIDDLAEHNNFSFDEFESKLSGKGSHKISVNEAFQQKLDHNFVKNSTYQSRLRSVRLLLLGALGFLLVLLLGLSLCMLWLIRGGT